MSERIARIIKLLYKYVKGISPIAEERADAQNCLPGSEDNRCLYNEIIPAEPVNLESVRKYG